MSEREYYFRVAFIGGGAFVGLTYGGIIPALLGGLGAAMILDAAAIGRH